MFKEYIAVNPLRLLDGRLIEAGQKFKADFGDKQTINCRSVESLTATLAEKSSATPEETPTESVATAETPGEQTEAKKRGRPPKA